MDNPTGTPYCDREVYERLKSCGAETKIFRMAQLIGAERISLGRSCQIDDFVFMMAGESVDIGDRVHLACFTSIAGGGRFVMESYAGLAAGCRIITGSEDWTGRALTNPCIPAEFRSVKRSQVIIRRHALLFTNVIVFPGVEIGEGCVVSAGAIVSKSLEPWGVYRMKGEQLVRVGDRKSERLLQCEREMVQKYGY